MTPTQKTIYLGAVAERAREKYGERLIVHGDAFIIDGIRLFLPVAEVAKGDILQLVERLGELLAVEVQARTVSETK